MNSELNNLNSIRLSKQFIKNEDDLQFLNDKNNILYYLIIYIKNKKHWIILQNDINFILRKI